MNVKIFVFEIQAKKISLSQFSAIFLPMTVKFLFVTVKHWGYDHHKINSKWIEHFCVSESIMEDLVKTVLNKISVSDSELFMFW